MMKKAAVEFVKNIFPKLKRSKHQTGFVIGLLFFIQSCAPLISGFDQYSYVQTISVKVDALNLMDMAVDSFALRKKELAEVQTGIQKMYEYEKHRPKNEITTKLWETLTDTSGNLYGGFLVKWKKEVVLKKVYVENKKEQIAKAFDQIIELESKKIKNNK